MLVYIAIVHETHETNALSDDCKPILKIKNIKFARASAVRKR